MKKFRILLVVLLSVLVLSGCGKDPTFEDVSGSFKNLDKATSYTIYNVYMIDDTDSLYDEKKLEIGMCEGKKIAKLTIESKRLNTFEDAGDGKFKVTNSVKYYYDNQIGEYVDGEFTWRAGLIEELTNDMNNATYKLEKAYFSDYSVIGNAGVVMLKGSIKDNYINQFFGKTVENVSQLKVTIQTIKEDNVPISLAIEYKLNGKLCESIIEYGYSENTITLDGFH